MSGEKQRKTLADILGKREFDHTVKLPDGEEVTLRLAPVSAWSKDEIDRLYPMPPRPDEETEEYTRARDAALANRLSVIVTMSHAATDEGRAFFDAAGATDTVAQVKALKSVLDYPQIFDLGLEVQRRSTLQRTDVEEAKGALSPTESSEGSTPTA